LNIISSGNRYLEPSEARSFTVSSIYSVSHAINQFLYGVR